MPVELNLRFPDATHVIVRFGSDDDGSQRIPFQSPLSANDLRDLQWYVETYGAHSLGDPDDAEARRIAGQLSVWGKALFDAVFTDRDAQRRFNAFQDAERSGARLLTISAEHPSVLALPWELLHDPSPGGGFLFMENPRISIRRRVAGVTGGRKPFRVRAKETIRLLFVISRPQDTGFLDPRADALPILDAVDEHAPGQVHCEFLQPPTLQALIDRLEDDTQPPVDILHFDGHGVFDREGGLPARIARARAQREGRKEEILRSTAFDDAPAGMGYLLFESDEGDSDFVSAEKLGANLHRHRVALVILSACQSAAVELQPSGVESDVGRPMGSVASRLTATGIPSVLAMTHSVLVHTTRTLFGEFYKELAKQKRIGEALDNARRFLANNPEKYDVQRGAQRVPLKLHDWFLPALYQPGADGSLLRKREPSEPRREPKTMPTNVAPEPEGGFFGRRKELWQIERWFGGPTKRITITGFGGQGKTALAQEAARWLMRIGMFEAAVFVDYSRVQGNDAVSVAVSNIATVARESLVDAAAATRALEKTATLVILDNLETLAAEPSRALLDVAVEWSTAGRSRVLCTTRRPEFDHPEFRVTGTNVHRRIVLDGLGSRRAPDDALEWFATLAKLPLPPVLPPHPRHELVELFDRVNFHPLSIRVLAQQLKTRSPKHLGHRLEELLRAGTIHAGEGTPAGLVASIQLSLDQLDVAARDALPRLGVFQGGAFEDDLLVVTGLGEPDHDAMRRMLAAAESGDVQAMLGEMGMAITEDAPPEVVDEVRRHSAQIADELRERLQHPPENIWPSLRQQLEAASLIRVEQIPSVAVPFVRFHPTLAPILWLQLSAEAREELAAAHRRRYYELSGYLYRRDKQDPHHARAIAWIDLPNLLHAALGAVDHGDADAADFADNVGYLLDLFSLKRQSDDLTERVRSMESEPGSRDWYLTQSNIAEALLEDGDPQRAMTILEAILQELGPTPSLARGSTLARVARCLTALGQTEPAVALLNSTIQECSTLEKSESVALHLSKLRTDLAVTLQTLGRFTEARQSYELSLELKRDAGGDKRGEGVVLGQLGSLDLMEGKLQAAEQRYYEALPLFQSLREPASEAVIWHQLGIVSERLSKWDDAEWNFRQAARIKEENGIIFGMNGITTTWNHLANVSKHAGRPEAAESWYRKAISLNRTRGVTASLATEISNLALLLYEVSPERLDEARQLAEEALALKKQLDPSVTQIWRTHRILSDIATAEASRTSDPARMQLLRAEAREHRRLARESRLAFDGTLYELRRHIPLILSVIETISSPESRPVFEPALARMEQLGWTALVPALRRTLDGERDADELCLDLDEEDSIIVATILRGLSDPSTLERLSAVQDATDSS